MIKESSLFREANEDIEPLGYRIVHTDSGHSAERFSLVHRGHAFAWFEFYDDPHMAPNSMFVRCGDQAWWSPPSRFRLDVRRVVRIDRKR